MSTKNETPPTNETPPAFDIAPQIGQGSLGPRGTFAYTPPEFGPEFTDRFSFGFQFADGTKVLCEVRVSVRQTWEPKPSQAGSAPEILAARQRG